MVINPIDSSLAALVHPNSTTMRRCFELEQILIVIVSVIVSVHIILVISITTIDIRCIDETTSVLTRKLIK